MTSLRITDPEIVQRLFLGLDGDYDDNHDVFISVRKGGIGSTSASVEVEITEADPSNRRATFRVSITRPEPGDDDYDGEEV